MKDPSLGVAPSFQTLPTSSPSSCLRFGENSRLPRRCPPLPLVKLVDDGNVATANRRSDAAATGNSPITLFWQWIGGGRGKETVRNRGYVTTGYTTDRTRAPRWRRFKGRGCTESRINKSANASGWYRFAPPFCRMSPTFPDFRPCHARTCHFSLFYILSSSSRERRRFSRINRYD